MTLSNTIHPNETTAVGELIQLIEMHAKKRGLNVSRWQANKGNYHCTVTWAVHKGERPSFTRDLPDDAFVVRFSGREGKTKRCAAYKALYQLLEEVR